ncbi:FtsX-like permease family protein [Desulfohalovibrio reitneri]|uniref:FtsX-like permease family protein n=1 Tax=Desulfohalovibrio reitneri TaxID=1307759 RepID=UPI0004A704DF|nr:FtsX-like permease family protein [Desulfohalovibrio reitneri]
MIVPLAYRNLVHDKVRLAVTLIGVIFAVVLISVQLGLFIGFTTTISGVIDNSGADVWVASRGIKNFDIALPMEERTNNLVMAVPGVARTGKLIIQFANWKKPNGDLESIEIVGYELEKGLGGPWNLVEGNTDWLDIRDTIVVDRLYAEKLGVVDLGDSAEIANKRARVVAFTHGIRSFTTSPYVFTSFKNALEYSTVQEDQLVYILVEAADGVSSSELKKRILARVDDVDVFTTGEFSLKTINYWMLSTGAGMALLIAAFLGLVVGMVVVAQTLYATTMDHLPEFATLKAVGAPNAYIYRILIAQAVISAVGGYLLGMAASLGVARLSQNAEALIRLPWPVVGGMFFLTLAMCLGASLVSINKITQTDPMLVFKGR